MNTLHPREAEQMLRAWLRKEYYPKLRHLDAFVVPEGFDRIEKALGPKRCREIFREERPS